MVCLPTLTVSEVLAHARLVREVAARVMVEGLDYGTVPGCGPKPVLLKGGAERLCVVFRLAPSFQVEETRLEGGHREYRLVCSLSTMGSGTLVGQGVGVCSSLEAKYRFRQGQGEPTDKPVPRAYWDLRQEDPAKAQELIGGKGFSTRKVEGKGWMICKGGEKTEHDNPADHYNTVLKMAKKRALVDAVLTATAASSVFGQDLEEGAAVAESAVALSPARSRPVVKFNMETARQTAAAVPTAPSVDWRTARVPFGKNQGRTLAELSDEQVGWYLERWLPRREQAGPLGAEDAALAAGLRAYGRWRAMVPCDGGQG